MKRTFGIAQSIARPQPLFSLHVVSGRGCSRRCANLRAARAALPVRPANRPAKIPSREPTRLVAASDSGHPWQHSMGTVNTVLTNGSAGPMKILGRHQVAAEPVYHRWRVGSRVRGQGGCARWLFAREMFSRPATVGAIGPSSGRLARSVASRVPCLGDGLVVELGGGTGAVTQALLQRGIAPIALRWSNAHRHSCGFFERGFRG